LGVSRISRVVQMKHMGYQLNLATISLDQFKHKLRSKDLIPSRQVLLEDIDQHFHQLASQAIKDVATLFNAIKTKKKLEQFAAESEVPIDYLTILAREVKSYLKKPIKLTEFPGIAKPDIEKLNTIGINTTAQLYDRILSKEDRQKLAQEADLELETITRLGKLTDLTRIKWVNHTFAVVLYEAGYQSVASVQQGDAEEMNARVRAANAKHQIFKGNLGHRDINRCIEEAQDLETEMM
jgi:hypothetical protein